MADKQAEGAAVAAMLPAKREAPMAVTYNESTTALIRRTVAKGASEVEFELFMYQCQRTGLDPLSRQIYCVMRWDRKADRNVMTIQTAIDGYRVIAQRTGAYAGNDDYEFDDPNGRPQWAKARVWRIVQGLRVAFEATARWEEYFPGEKQGMMWKKMPHVMLGKCAEALALRKAFPAELSGLYTNDEMAQAGAPVTIDAELVEVKPPKPDVAQQIGDAFEAGMAAEETQGTHLGARLRALSDKARDRFLEAFPDLDGKAPADLTPEQAEKIKPWIEAREVYEQGVYINGFPEKTLYPLFQKEFSDLSWEEPLFPGDAEAIAQWLEEQRALAGA